MTDCTDEAREARSAEGAQRAAEEYCKHDMNYHRRLREIDCFLAGAAYGHERGRVAGKREGKKQGLAKVKREMLLIADEIPGTDLEHGLLWKLLKAIEREMGED